jgi:hypothetical protein
MNMFCLRVHMCLATNILCFRVNIMGLRVHMCLGMNILYLCVNIMCPYDHTVSTYKTDVSTYEYTEYPCEQKSPFEYTVSPCEHTMFLCEQNVPRYEYTRSSYEHAVSVRTDCISI